MEKRRIFITETLRKLGYEPPKPKPLVLTEQQAVIIIQSHERARQGRLRFAIFFVNESVNKIKTFTHRLENIYKNNHFSIRFKLFV